MKHSDVSVGQSYLPAGKSLTPLRTRTWTVTNVFQGKDGNQYAKLVNDRDPSLVKTVSTSALTDPGMFVLREPGL